MTRPRSVLLHISSSRVAPETLKVYQTRNPIDCADRGPWAFASHSTMARTSAVTRAFLREKRTASL